MAQVKIDWHHVQVPPHPHKSWVSLVAGLALAAIVAVACALHLWDEAPALMLVAAGVSVILSAAPLFIRDEIGTGGASSRMLAIAGMLWPTNLLFSWRGEFSNLLTMFGSSGFLWAMTGAVLLYPKQRLQRHERWFMVLLAIGLCGPDIYAIAAKKSFDQIPIAVPLYAFLGVGVVFIGFRRFRSYEGVERQTLVFPLLAGMLLAINAGVSWAIILNNGMYTAGANLPLIYMIFFIQGIQILVLTPASFIAPGLRRRHIQTAVAKALRVLPHSASMDDVQQVLRSALGDERLIILYPSPDEADVYIDSQGRAVELPDDSSHQLVIRIRVPHSKPVILLVNPDLAREAAFIESTLSARTKSLITAWLRASARFQEKHRRAVQMRIEAARMADKQWLGEWLHDHIQQRLSAITLQLGIAEAETADESLRERLSQTLIETQTVLKDLRLLASSIDPVELKSDLRLAITEMADRLPFPVRTKIDDMSVPAVVKRRVYFAVSEALTNVIKHSRATQAIVIGKNHSSALEICVKDDGIGGAGFILGSGLANHRDRIEALGGELTLISPTGEGTTVCIRIPYE